MNKEATNHQDPLLRVADDLEQHPLLEEFLHRYALPADTREGLRRLAGLVRGYRRLPPSLQTQVDLLGAGLPEVIVREICHELRLQEMMSQPTYTEPFDL